MHLELVTGPNALITTAEAKLYLKVDQSVEDSLIDRLVSSATRAVENITGRALMSQTWKEYFDDFGDGLVLQKSPLQSVTHVKYFNEDGAEQTLSSDVYRITKTTPAKLVLVTDEEWPSYSLIESGIEVQFVAGYASASVVPPDLVACVYELIGVYYHDRQGKAGVPDRVRRALAPYEVHHEL